MPSSALFKALSRAETLGVEFPRARDGVGGGSRVSADKVGLCFVDGFLVALFFSTFFASMTFLKSFKENSNDIFGFTQRDLACARVYASLGPRSWLIYIPYAIINVADRLAPCWQCTRTFFPSFTRDSMVWHRSHSSSFTSVLWSHGTWMYSGSFFSTAGFGVVGEDSVELDGWTSNAVANDIVEAAVSGVKSRRSGPLVESEGFEELPSFCSPSSVISLNGFFTSLATFMMTSNFIASSILGSK